MNYSIVRIGLLITAIGLSIAGRAFSEEEAFLKKQFHSESLQGWEALKEFYAHCDVTGTETQVTHVKGGGEVARRCTVLRLKRNGDLWLRELATCSGNGGKEGALASGINSRYRFALRRGKNSQPWVVRDYTPLPVDHTKARTELEYQYLMAPWLIVPGKPLNTWVQERGFALKEIAAFQENGHSYAKLHFDYKSMDDNRDAKVVNGGWIVLDPNRQWSIQAYEIATSFGRVSGKLQYNEDTDGIPVLQDVKIRIINTGTKKEQENHFEVQDFSHREVPENEFTLSAFNLPELSQTPGNANGSLPFLLISLGFIFMCIGLLLYRQRLRTI